MEINKNTLPNRSEIKRRGKEAIISTPGLIESLYKFNNKLISECEVWIHGYATGALHGEFKTPIDNSEVKEFYIERIIEYITYRLIEDSN